MKDQKNISPIEQYVIDFVRDLRNKRNLTQDDLGSILGVGKSFVSNVESLNHRAKYNLNHVNALADYFALKPSDFLPEKAIPVDKSKSEDEKDSSPALVKKITVKKKINKITVKPKKKKGK